MFSYSGCEGNDNRFKTLDECVSACDPGGLDRCTLSSDCMVRDAACCAACEPVKKVDLAAVNKKYAGVPVCPNIGCGACFPYEGVPVAPNFGAQCVNSRCSVYDVRETAAVTCTTDADCRLRIGLGCCEGCSMDGVGIWVAVNVSPATEKSFCEQATTCITCDRTAPVKLRATCVVGKCQAVALP